MFPRTCRGDPQNYTMLDNLKLFSPQAGAIRPSSAPQARRMRFPRVRRDDLDKERTLDKVERFPRKRGGDSAEKRYAEGHKMCSLLMQG